jgi:hypothetical protein
MEEAAFKIRAYGVTELALCYNPDCSPNAAFRRLRSWIAHSRSLSLELEALGRRKGDKLFTPAQVAAIVRHLGEP